MSDKNADLDILGESHIPEDLLTPTLGSNYGLDGFPTLDYGAGVLEGVLDPEHLPAPALPDGLARAGAVDLNLDFLDEDGLADLSWLDPTQLQDPERLPETPQSIPELEEAWGGSTDGVRTWERDIKRARFEGDAQEKKATLTAKVARKVVTHAMRRSIAGQDIDTIVRQARESVGLEAHKLDAALEGVRAEHGLHGNVFVRASAFPDWHNRGGVYHVKRYAKQAQYLVVSKDQLQNAVWIQNGRCQYTGKKAVLQVPWQKALAHYGPRLKASGHRLASGHPKDVLRAAFLAGPQREAPQTAFVRNLTPDQRIGLREAQEVLRNYKAPERKVYDRTADLKAVQAADAQEHLRKLVRLGQVSEQDARSILEGSSSPRDIYRSAQILMNRVASGSYSGTSADGLEGQRALNMLRLAERAQREAAQHARADGIRQERRAADKRAQAEEAARKILGWRDAGFLSDPVTQKILASPALPARKLEVAAKLAARARSRSFEGTDAGRNMEEWSLQKALGLRQREEASRERAAEAAASNRLAAVKKKVARIEQEVNRGVRGKTLRRFISNLLEAGERAAAIKMLAPLLKKTSALKDQVKQTKQYDQPTFTRAASVKKEAGVAEGQILAALKGVRQAMAEGLAGKDLTDYLEHRYSERLLAAAATRIASLRDEHEGGSGFLYVDAAAYASPHGVTGCESGALKHRANSIPKVVEMERCGSCSHSRRLASGEYRCSLYNKLFTRDISSSSVRAQKQANIKMANAPDEERTAALFQANNYDPTEFDLTASHMEDFIDEEVSTEKLAEVLFGGWDLDV
jgi:hypothetical protein